MSRLTNADAKELSRAKGFLSEPRGTQTQTLESTDHLRVCP